MSTFLGFKVSSDFKELQEMKEKLIAKNWFEYLLNSEFKLIYDNLILEEKLLEIKDAIEKEFNSR